MMPSGSCSLMKYQSSSCRSIIRNAPRYKKKYMTFLHVPGKKWHSKNQRKILSIPKIPLVQSVLGKKHRVVLVGWLPCRSAAFQGVLKKLLQAKFTSTEVLIFTGDLSLQELRAGVPPRYRVSLCLFFCWVKSRLLGENIIIAKIYLLSFHGLKNQICDDSCHAQLALNRRAILLRSASSTSHWQLDIINLFSFINLSTSQCLWDSVFFTSSPDPSRRPERGCFFFQF